MPSDKAKIRRSAYEAYADTNAIQHETQFRLNDKAIEVLKVNLIVGGIMASIVTFSPENIRWPYYVAGSISLLLSTWYCAWVYSQTKTYDIGLSKDAIDDIFEVEDLEEHFTELSKAYRNLVKKFGEPYEEEKSDFEIGLWGAIATVIYVILGGASTLFIYLENIPYPLYVDVFVVFAIAIGIKQRDTVKAMTEKII